MGKKAKCFADGGVIGQDGLTDAQRAKKNAALQGLGMSTTAPAPQQPAPTPAPPLPAPTQPPIATGQGILGILKNRGREIDKATGYANGGIINDAAEYWANDNAEFEKTNPGFVDRVVRGVNPLTGFGSAMGAMHTAAGNGDIPGMAMAGIQAIPAVGVLRAIPAAGAMKASVAPSLATTAGAIAGGAVANAAADEFQKRDNNYQASGYACGGKVKGHALGGKIEGIGTPTSDSIDASVRETGEQIKVSTDERIVSKAQDKLLQRLAKAMGYESLDAYLEAGTGKPVGPTIKDGKAAAEDGMSPEERDRRLESGNIAGQWIGRSSTPTIGASDQSGEYSNALKTAPSLSGYVNRGDPVKDVATGIANVFSDSAKAARGEDGTYNEIVAARKARESGQVLGSVPGAQATNPAASAATIPVGGIADIPIGQNYGNEGRSVPQRISKSNPGVVVDNENQFTQGGRTYTSAPTSQQGISRITATGANPLYTNIKPEDAVSGLSRQPVQTGQPSVQPPVQQDTQQPEGIARIERANQIRGEMIDSAIKANGGNGVGILNTEQTLPGGMSISDWNNRVSSGFNTQMSPKEKAAYLAMEGAQGIQRTGQDLLNQQAAARNTLEARGQDLRSAREADRDQVTMRGQDINALGDKAKLAMLERNDQRQAEQFNLQRRISEGQLADSEAQRSARTAMAAALEKGDTEGYKQAVKQATIAGIKLDGEKSPKFAEIADPNDKSGLRKIPVQYNSDGTYTVMKPAAQQRTYAEFEKAYLAKRPGSTPEQMKADYQQLYGAK